ncbi:hypothetical protein [Massilia glaciei]|uniref:hypothetical protein n=1 Tax=Massilia glaciei TaxID=1524097 RepID=UPI0011B26C0F|nr:hypothetical protein [Massilia glaciei]
MTVSKIKEINDLHNDELLAEPTELVESARCLEKYIERHGEQNLSFYALRGLAILTIERIEQGRPTTKFTAQNILAAAEISTPEGKAAGTLLSQAWNKLIDNILPKRKKGIQDFARNLGLNCYPWPVKDKSDGGLPSKYYLIDRPLPESDIQTIEPVVGDQIAYIRELTPELAWWAKPLIRNGYRLEGWRRWLFLTYGVGFILLCGILIMFSLGLLWSEPTWSLRGLSSSIIFTGLFAYASWMLLRPFFRLLEWRITMAPTALIALSEFNVQMEIVRDSQFNVSPGTIRLVRYASTCPQCKAKIEVEEGGKEFANRLVGRCRENPGEHIYSFDRFTCKGRTLR